MAPTKHVGVNKVKATRLDYQANTLWPVLPAVDGRLGAPFGGEAADCYVDLLVEAEEIADDAPIQEGAVGVGVGKVGW